MTSKKLKRHCSRYQQIDFYQKSDDHRGATILIFIEGLATVNDSQ